MQVSCEEGFGDECAPKLKRNFWKKARKIFSACPAKTCPPPLHLPNNSFLNPGKNVFQNTAAQQAQTAQKTDYQLLAVVPSLCF
ncbi:MAG: hypothetical protein ACK4Q5_16105 [Saprospiraceae bacterium]